jgi:hypothetical protein
MRRIEKANKLELALPIKALVALALADELIEGRPLFGLIGPGDHSPIDHFRFDIGRYSRSGAPV